MFPRLEDWAASAARTVSPADADCDERDGRVMPSRTIRLSPVELGAGFSREEKCGALD